MSKYQLKAEKLLKRWWHGTGTGGMGKHCGRTNLPPTDVDKADKIYGVSGCDIERLLNIIAQELESASQHEKPGSGDLVGHSCNMPG